MADTTLFVPMFPMWTMVDKPLYESRGLSAGLTFVGTGLSGHGSAFPLFTTRESAERYTASVAPKRDFAAYLIPDAAELAQLLASATRMGMTHAAINQYADGTMRAEYLVPIGDLRG